jgi:helicase
VATTTVAAGVNLPTRAVIVHDTQVGFGELDTATVLQMFGRSRRAGTGEQTGGRSSSSTSTSMPPGGEG